MSLPIIITAALGAALILLIAYIVLCEVADMIRDARHGTARQRRDAKAGLCGVGMIAGSGVAVLGAATVVGVASPLWAAAGAAVLSLGLIVAVLCLCAGLAF